MAMRGRARSGIVFWLSSWGIGLVASLLWIGVTQPVAADIYSFTDSNGVIHLTDRPLGPEYRLLIASPKESKADQKKRAQARKESLARQPVSSRVTGVLPGSPAGGVYGSAPGARVIRYDGRQERRDPRAGLVSLGGIPFSGYAGNGSMNDTIQDASQRYRIHTALIKAVIKTESDFNPLAVSPKGAVGLMQLMPGTAQDLGVVDRTDPVENIHGGVRYLREMLEQFNNDLVLSLAAYNAGPGAVKKHGNTVPPYEETQHYVAKVLHYYRAYLAAM
ncbi:MAG: lytic transglycosylase domain-containing protein [Magnetococcales bacterium]|nr:lytic transglycosylase domain-containing protein [Magnetococcales bacterium]